MASKIRALGASRPARGCQGLLCASAALREANLRALVVSPRAYNARAGNALFCPITRRVKGYPFEVELPEGLDATGCILSDQVKSLDWRERKAKRWCRVPPEVSEEVRGRALALPG